MDVNRVHEELTKVVSDSLPVDPKFIIRAGALHAEDALLRWHHAHRARAGGFHGAAGGVGAPAPDAPDALSRGVRTAPHRSLRAAIAPEQRGKGASKAASMFLCGAPKSCRATKALKQSPKSGEWCYTIPNDRSLTIIWASQL